MPAALLRNAKRSIQPFRLREAARLLRNGGVIAYPTEAVYGLGCDPLNRDAVGRILAIKQRPMAKGMILIASEFAQLTPFVLPPSPDIQGKLDRTWPGPVTWLLPSRPETPAWLRGSHATIAVRITDHPLARALCDAFGGAIVSTSANASGRPPARTALQARLRCPGVDHVVTGPTGGRQKPSEIRDATSEAVMRAG
jgi:L-threonylcarbamoyladenylate synthase